MTSSIHPPRLRLGAAALVIAGVFFILYPALRPFSDEVSLEGAAAFGSSAWLAAHMLAMVAFTLVALGLHSLYSSVQGTKEEPLGYWAFVLALLGAGFTLPFYGGEAYGLYAIGQEAMRQHTAALVGLAGVVRSGPGLLLGLTGLLMLAVSAILSAIVTWRSPIYSRWSGVPFALGFALYIPQFFATQPIRVAHGVVVAIGCLWIAAALWQHREAG